jgi:hypothetical protein
MTPIHSNSSSTRPWRIIDLTGQVFGRLTVLGIGDRRASGRIRWMCRCVCGTEKNIDGTALKGGLTNSCGCLRVELTSIKFFKHGHTRGKKNSPEFSVWSSMLSRCTNPKNVGWEDYIGRGITVCQRWRESFQNFLDDMGTRPSLSHSIDRINNNGNYEPGNCKWATKREQSLNRRPRSVCWHGHPLTEDNVTGKRRRCRICRNTQARERRRKDKDTVLNPVIVPLDLPVHIIKHSANLKVASAIRRGELKRQPCEICGNPKAVAHHEDYGKPLDVNWLCRSCHSKRHKEINAEKKKEAVK